MTPFFSNFFKECQVYTCMKYINQTFIKYSKFT